MPAKNTAGVVYPAPDVFLEGIPHAPITGPADITDRLIETGAFTGAAARDAGEQPDPVELTDDQIARLDFYHMPEDAPAPTESAVPAGVDETQAEQAKAKEPAKEKAE